MKQKSKIIILSVALLITYCSVQAQRIMPITQTNAFRDPTVSERVSLDNMISIDNTGNLIVGNSKGNINKVTPLIPASVFSIFTASSFPNFIEHRILACSPLTNEVYSLNLEHNKKPDHTDTTSLKLYKGINFLKDFTSEEPSSISFDAAGNLYACIPDSNRIEIMSPSGVRLSDFLVPSDFVGTFKPHAICFDLSGNTYISLGGASVSEAIIKVTSNNHAVQYASGLGSGTNTLCIDALGNLYTLTFNLGPQGLINKIPLGGTTAPTLVANIGPCNNNLKMVMGVDGNFYFPHEDVVPANRAIMRVTLLPCFSYSVTNTSICSSELPFTFNKKVFTTAHSDTVQLIASNGCDSIATLNLTLKDSFAINASTNNAGGSITPSGNLFYCKGSNQTYTIAKNVGFVLSDVSVDGVSKGAISSFPFSNISANHTIIANFTPCTLVRTFLDTTVCRSQLPVIFQGKSFNIVTGSSLLDSVILRNTTGCDTIAVIKLSVFETAPSITGAVPICVGSRLQLSNRSSVGIWSSLDPTIANTNAIGLVTAINPGTARISYFFANCGQIRLNSVTTNITINALPAIPTITPAANAVLAQNGAAGANNYCNNRQFNLNASPTGGTFNGIGAFTVGSTTGIVTTKPTTGSGSVTYSFSDVNGCKSSNSLIVNVVDCQPPTVITGTGTLGNINMSLSRFKSLIGETLNTSPFASSNGHREVNWDIVPLALTNTNNLPGDFFNGVGFGIPDNRKMGLVLNTTNTPTQFRVDSTNFRTIDASYSTQFEAFSGKRAFANIGNTATTATFFRVGTTTNAFVKGFGIVFSDVDNETNTTLEFFNESNKSLGVFKVPARDIGSSFSFLGVFFPNPNDRVSKVTITCGNGVLASGVKDISSGGLKDLVVMDDFLFDEPK